MRKTLVIVLLTALSAFCQDPAGAAKKPENETVQKGILPQVGAYYFYWYRHDDHHFKNPDGTDALFQHFPKPKTVDHDDVSWHKDQLRAMMHADLDIVLPVYWGVPDKTPSSAKFRWADTGLDALVKARSEIAKTGANPPRIAMFYDTSTLLHRVRGEDEEGALDLMSPKGLTVFCDTIVRFFDRVPDEHRFKLNEHCVMVTYSAFGARHDRLFFATVAKEIERRKGIKLFIIAEESWKARAHSRYKWGSALNGPTGNGYVMTLGPGYNDTPVPDRGTPIRDREDGRFFMWSWDRVLVKRPTLVFIETWNEFHEGTGIAPSKEFGTDYLEITRRYVKRLKNGIVPDPRRPVRLIRPDPVPRPDVGWWRRKADAVAVSYQPSRARGVSDDGLRIARVPDGPFRLGYEDDRSVVTTAGAGSSVTYLYCGIADEFAHRTAKSYVVDIDVQAGSGKVGLQYDAWDRAAPLKGSYKDTPKDEGTGARKLRFTLPDARFANRQNGGADFRIVVAGGNVSITRIEVRRLERKLEDRPTVTQR